MSIESPTASAAFRIVKPQKARWHGRLMAWLVFGVTRLFTASIRFRIHPVHNHVEEFGTPSKPQNVIFCIWHNRLFLSLACYFIYVVKAQPKRKMAALVSASRDGGMLTRVLELYNIVPIRGSSSRRGAQALVELNSSAAKGLDISITPDGPRGPRYQIHPGVITLAQLTGLPILPITYHLSRKITLKSWDRFQIPLPFCTCTVAVGKPVHIPRELTPEEREAWRQKLNQIMLDQTED